MANLNKGKKKKGEKKPVDEDKIPGAVKEASRVGLRQYARGRAYDPYRYSADGPTVYPGEEPIFAPKADSRALKHEAAEAEQALGELHTDEAIEDSILAGQTAEETPAIQAPEAAAEEQSPAQEPEQSPAAPEAQQADQGEKKE